MIEQQKISAISNRTSQGGGRRIPELVIERDYCLAWLLIGLSHFPIREKPIIKSYEEYSDFEENAKIKVYSLDEVIIEKVCALLSPERNEPRDLYDLWYILDEVGLDLNHLIKDIKAKCQFKGGNFDERRKQFAKKESRLGKLWKPRLDKQMSSLPKYDDVFRTVKRVFRQSGIMP